MLERSGTLHAIRPKRSAALRSLEPERMCSRPSATPTNKQGGRHSRHRTRKDPTAFRCCIEYEEYCLLIIYLLIHIICWFCHSHGDTTVSPKRRILDIILLSSCYHLAFIFRVLVCFCNVFLFCYVFLLLFIGVFLTKYH